MKGTKEEVSRYMKSYYERNKDTLKVKNHIKYLKRKRSQAPELPQKPFSALFRNLDLLGDLNVENDELHDGRS